MTLLIVDYSSFIIKPSLCMHISIFILKVFLCQMILSHVDQVNTQLVLRVPGAISGAQCFLMRQTWHRDKHAGTFNKDGKHQFLVGANFPYLGLDLDVGLRLSSIFVSIQVCLKFVAAVFLLKAL